MNLSQQFILVGFGIEQVREEKVIRLLGLGILRTDSDFVPSVEDGIGVAEFDGAVLTVDEQRVASRNESGDLLVANFHGRCVKVG